MDVKIIFYIKNTYNINKNIFKNIINILKIKIIYIYYIKKLELEKDGMTSNNCIKKLLKEKI